MTDEFEFVDATDETAPSYQTAIATFNSLRNSPGQTATIQRIVQLVRTTFQQMANSPSRAQRKGYLDSLNQELMNSERALNSEASLNLATTTTASLLIDQLRDLYDTYET